MDRSSHQNDGPPRNVLSDESIRKALQRANTANSHSNNPSRPSEASRRPSASSRPKSHTNCDCMGCRDTSYRNKLGATRRDSSGNHVHELDSSESPPIHCHVAPNFFGEMDTHQSSPRRTSSSGDSSRGSMSRKNSEHTSYMDSKGNHVMEHTGADAPAIATHYNWDSPDGVPNYARRTNSTSHRS